MTSTPFSVCLHCFFDRHLFFCVKALPICGIFDVLNGIRCFYRSIRRHALVGNAFEWICIANIFNSFAYELQICFEKNWLNVALDVIFIDLPKNLVIQNLGMNYCIPRQRFVDVHYLLVRCISYSVDCDFESIFVVKFN